MIRVKINVSVAMLNVHHVLVEWFLNVPNASMAIIYKIVHVHYVKHHALIVLLLLVVYLVLAQLIWAALHVWLVNLLVLNVKVQAILIVKNVFLDIIWLELCALNVMQNAKLVQHQVHANLVLMDII